MDSLETPEEGGQSGFWVWGRRSFAFWTSGGEAGPSHWAPSPIILGAGLQSTIIVDGGNPRTAEREGQRKVWLYWGGIVISI